MYLFVSVQAELEYGDISPNIMIATFGDSYSIICKSRSKPKWWYDRLEGSGKRVRGWSYVLRVKVKQSMTAGLFVCRGKDLSGNKFLASSLLLAAGK